MKRLFSLILTLSLVMSMGVTAFAAEGDQEGVQPGSYNADVKGTVTGGSAGEAVYSVDLKWEGLSFTYKDGDKTWDATNHKYNTTAGGWTDSDGKITVTNHSNAAVTATPTWTAGDDYKTVGMDFTYSNGDKALELASAETTKAAVEGTINVAPNGTLATSADGTKIGMITVTIAGENITNVYNWSGLRTALENGGKVVLRDNIACVCNGPIELAAFNADLDLNGYELTIVATDVNMHGTLTVSNGILCADMITIHGSLLIAGGIINVRTLDVRGTLTIDGGVFGRTIFDGDCIIRGGTFGNDPSAYVAEGYEATHNADGTYTVNAKAE